VATSLEGRVAIVTGAAGGVGGATTTRLLERGAHVVAVDISPAVHELAGDDVEAVEGDVAEAETAERAVAAALQRWRRVDILVNNAAMILYQGILETSEAEWDRLLAVNVRSAFLFSRAAIPAMLDGGAGAIVSTASISGLIGLPGQAAYAASKGAIVQLTKQLAVEFAPQGIRVNAVAPGAIDTPFLRRFVDAQEDPGAVEAGISGRHPLGRMATPGEVADAIVFLASDDAAFVTGTIFPVDGGFTAQ